MKNTLLLATCLLLLSPNILIGANSKIDSLENLLLQSIHDTSRLKAIHGLSIEYRLTEPSKSLIYANQSLELAEELNDYKKISNAHYNLSQIYIHLGNLELSFDHAEKCLDYAHQANEPYLIAYSYNNVAIVYSLEGDHDMAAKMYKQAYQISSEIPDSMLMSMADMNIGMSYNYMKNDSAIVHIDRAIEYQKGQNYEHGVWLGFYNKATYLYEHGDYDSALRLLEAKYENNLKLEYPRLYINYHLAMAQVALKAGEIEAAHKYLKSIEEKSGEQFNPDAQKYYLYTLYKVDSALGNYPAALENLRLYSNLADSIYENQKKERFENFKVLHETKQHQLQVIQLEAKHKRVRLIAVGIFAISLSLVAFIIYMVRMHQKKNLLVSELSEKNQSLQELNSTKDKFFTIIAHDLKNPIGAIKGILELLSENYHMMEDSKRKKQIDTIRDATQNFDYLLTELLDWSRSQTNQIKFNPTDFNLSELLQTVELYLEPACTNKGITLNTEIPEDYMIFADYNMVFTIFRNLVSNSIKFSERGKTISIRVKDRPDSMTAYVIDHGFGMTEKLANSLFKQNVSNPAMGSNNERGTGIGLMICKDFINKHGGSIGAKSKLNQGSTFWFLIPKNLSEEASSMN